jgi:hypothetical protein
MPVRPLIKRYWRVVDTVLVLLLALFLVGPVFRITYLDNWPSIESTFIADARILAGHLPHPSWQPYWYCGTRFDYIYPPALRYGTALIAVIGHTSTAKAYHVYIGLTYVFGIAAVYWLALLGSASRRIAWLSTITVALVSPCLILIRSLHDDSPWMIPQRLHVLMSYGEGPHISALSILGAALAASIVALREWRPAALALAGVFCALTVSNNFYGATALAFFFPVLAWSVWVGVRDRMVWVRGAGIAVLAYGLCASWLTPSYLRITWNNLKWVSSPGDLNSRLVMLVAVVVFCDVSFRWANRRPDRIWTCFTAGSALILSVYVLGYFYAGLRIIGEAPRLSPEFDLAVLLMLATAMDALWRARLRPEALAMGAVLMIPAGIYLAHVHTPFVKARNWQDQYERRITKWVHENLPGERVLASGTVRFWYDAWFDNPEMDGGSDQGMINQTLPAASFQVTQDARAEISRMWLQALGTSAVIVPDNTSPEPYHDYKDPAKFRGVLTPIYDDGHGTVVYRVPRIYSSLGRVIDRAKHATIGEPRGGDDAETLQRYVALVEAPQPETTVTWSGFDDLQVKAQVREGQSVLVQETYDSGWHAYENGRALKIRRDPAMSFMVIDIAPGTHTIDMKFEVPLENRVGQGLLAIALLSVAGLVFLASRESH